MFIPEEKGNLPVKEGTVDLTKYCRLTQTYYGIEQFERPPNFEVKIKTRKDTDHVHNAFDFCEELLTEIVFALDVPVSINFISMEKVTPKQGEKEDYVLVDYKYDDKEKWEPGKIGPLKKGNLVSIGAGWRSLVALRDGDIEKIRKRFGFLKNASSLVLEAVGFYKRGIKLVNYWINEAFLCFYKAIELFIPEYKKKYEEYVKKKIVNDFSLLIKKCRPNIPEQDIEQNLKAFLEWGKSLVNKELFRFICENTKFYERYKVTKKLEEFKEISKNLADIRASVAHPRVKEVTEYELKVCRDLAKHLIDIHA